jgi:hypothetical protein
VKCQAHGTSTWAVLSELWALGSKRAGVASLYRGLGTRAAVAALVGAFYLSSFHFFRWGQVSEQVGRGPASAARHRGEPSLGDIGLGAVLHSSTCCLLCAKRHLQHKAAARGLAPA